MFVGERLYVHIKTAEQRINIFIYQSGNKKYKQVNRTIYTLIKVTLYTAPSLIWILLTSDDVSLLVELLQLLVPILETMASEAVSLGLEVNWQRTKVKLWVSWRICH